MKLESVYTITYYQFEIIEENGQTTWYRRSTDDEPNWEQGFGESWESTYNFEKLEEIYKTWKKQKK